VYCFYCSEWFQRGDGWDAHCRLELERPLPRRCGTVTYRNTIILPAFCLFCRQSSDCPPSERLRYWERDADAIRHILETHKLPKGCSECGVSSVSLDHLYDVHGYRVSKTQISNETTARGPEPGSFTSQTAPTSAAEGSVDDKWWCGSNAVTGPELPNWLHGEPTLWTPSCLPSDTCGAADFSIHGRPELQETGKPELCLPPNLLQWSLCADGAFIKQGVKWTPPPASTPTDKAGLGLGSSLQSPVPASMPTSPLILANLSELDYASPVNSEEDLSFSQAATLDGNDGTDHTRKQGLDKPATRIKIVGKWADWGKSKGQGGCPPQSAAEDMRSNSPATPPALDAFMEEYFRFPSPSSDAGPILSTESPNSGNEPPGTDAPAPQFKQRDNSYRPSLAAVGALPGAGDFSYKNVSSAVGFQADAETRSVGARGRSQRGGLSAALANDEYAQRRVRIKMIGRTGRTGEETDEPPRKRIKMVRRCGVCGKPGHDARTCEETAESSESAICDVIVVRP
jgi:hypothetical protein